MYFEYRKSNINNQTRNETRKGSDTAVCVRLAALSTASNLKDEYLNVENRILAPVLVDIQSGKGAGGGVVIGYLPQSLDY